MDAARSWRDGLVEALALVERTPAGAGAWQFGPASRPGGVVLVEHGRLCWAVAHGGRRLTDVLVEEHALDRALVHDVYRRCQGDGTPLGQALVSAGLVAEAALRAALLQQSAEALVLLASTPEPPRWMPHRTGSYAPQYTFTASEVAASATAIATGADASARAAALAAMLGGGGWGAAYSPGAPPLPVAVVGAAPAFEDVVALGAWAQGVTAAWSRRRGPPRLVTWRLHAASVVAWTDPDGPCAAVCEDPATVSRLLARHVRFTEE